MTAYAQYSYREFIEDESFRKGVYEPESDEAYFWKQWVQAHPQKEKEVETARAMLLSIRGEKAALSAAYVKKQVSQLLQQVEQPGVHTRPFAEKPWIAAVALAACLVLAVLMGWYVLTIHPSQKMATKPEAAGTRQVIREIVNNSSTERKVTLPDGSIIYLLSHSKISFPEPFHTAYREVNLSGEAFFEIAKNPSQPFFVYANELVTKVLGTSFLIKAYEKDEEVRVIVKTGKVSVFADTNRVTPSLQKNTKPDSLVLTPNQQAVLIRRETRLIKTDSMPAVLPAVPAFQKLFTYDRASIADVFQDLEQTYGIDILYDANTMKNCTITAQLEKESLAEKLELICLIVEGEYELVDNLVIIRSKACQ